MSEKVFFMQFLNLKSIHEALLSRDKNFKSAYFVI